MLRNAFDNLSPAGIIDLSLESGKSVTTLFAFIDRNISDFSVFWKTYVNSVGENRISDGLVVYFTRCLDKDFQGFAPYHFSKNPTQSDSGKETDIGVRVPLNADPMNTIAEFEAKRLSNTSANTEYVYGTRGGMERFKRGNHASHLNLCGMFGYIQSKTIDEWTGKINEWIQGLANTNTDSSIDWKPMAEKLIQLSEEKSINKWRSQNDRRSSVPIRLYHYFIDLC